MIYDDLLYVRKKLKQDLNITDQDIAEIVDVKYLTIRAWFIGQRNLPPHWQEIFSALAYYIDTHGADQLQLVFERVGSKGVKALALYKHVLDEHDEEKREEFDKGRQESAEREDSEDRSELDYD